MKKETTLQRVAKRRRILERIARQVLGVETLESRKSDELDFKECAVWSILSAMEQAFEAGRGCDLTSEKIWACQATVDGKQVPTFYLHGATQGIVDKKHAEQIAFSILYDGESKSEIHLSVEEI